MNNLLKVFILLGQVDFIVQFDLSSSFACDGSTRHSWDIQYSAWDTVFIGFEHGHLHTDLNAVAVLHILTETIFHSGHNSHIFINISDEKVGFITLAKLNTIVQKTPFGLFVTTIFFPSNYFASVKQFIQNYTSFPIASNIITCFIDKTSKSFSNTVENIRCFEVYKIKSINVWRELPVWISLFNECHPEIYNLYNIWTLNRRSDFKRVEVPATAVETPLVAQFSRDEVQGVYLASGMQAEEYFYLRDALNFTAKAVINVNALTDSNGILNNYGMAKSLNTGEADIGIITHEFVISRISGPHRIQYLHPTHYTQSLVVFVQPPANLINNIYVKSFEFNLWIALALTCLIMYAAITFGILISKQFQLPYDYTINSDLFLWIIAVLTQKSLHRTPKFPFFRGCCLTTFLASAIIYSVYSSNLIALLSIGAPAIKSVNDLVKAGFFMHYNKYSPSMLPILSCLNGQNANTYSTKGIYLQEALPLLFGSKIAFLTQSDAFYYLFQDGYEEGKLCETISLLPISSQKVISANFIRHGSEYKEYFNRVLLQIRERGVKTRLIHHYNLEATPNCLGSTHYSKPDSIRFSDIYAVLAFLTGSIFVVIITFLLERVCSGALRKES